MFVFSAFFHSSHLTDCTLSRLGATLVLLSSQLTFIFKFFLSHNIRIACKHAWDQTIASRGKGPAFWQPYVEEWDLPPKIDVNQWVGLEKVKSKALRFAVKHCALACSCKTSFDKGLTLTVILIPLHVIPVAGLVVVATFKALDTAQHLHKPVCAFCVCHYFIKPMILCSTFNPKK